MWDYHIDQQSISDIYHHTSKDLFFVMSSNSKSNEWEKKENSDDDRTWGVDMYIQ